jgi:hypothetical protein
VDGGKFFLRLVAFTLQFAGKVGCNNLHWNWVCSKQPFMLRSICLRRSPLRVLRVLCGHNSLSKVRAFTIKRLAFSMRS